MYSQQSDIIIIIFHYSVALIKSDDFTCNPVVSFQQKGLQLLVFHII